MDINGQKIEVYAWVGEDEFGSGRVGLKQHLLMTTLCAIVSMDRHKIDNDDVRQSMNTQAATYGKKIRLCRFEMVEVVFETEAGE